MTEQTLQRMQAPTWAVLAAGVALNVGIVVVGAYSVFETKESSANYRAQVNARQDRQGEYSVKAVEGIQLLKSQMDRMEGKMDALLNRK